MARVVMLVENNVYPQDVRVRSEAQSLIKAGHDVTVLAPRGEGQSRRERVGGVRVRRFRLPKTPATTAGYIAEYAMANARLYLAGAWQLIRGARVVHLHNPPDTLFGVGMMARALGRDVVFDQHDLSPELFEAKFGSSRTALRLFRWFERRSFRISTLVIAPNESHKEIAIRRGGVAAERVTVVRNGPPRASLGEATEPRAGELTDPHLIFLGSMESQDGVDDLVGIFEALVRRHGFPQAKLTLVGEGSRRATLTDRFAAAGLSGQVHFTGFVAHREVAGLLGEADICLDPAPCTELNDHSTMVKVAEYMAARRAVVCFPLLETRRTASDAVAFAECGDVESFGAQIAALARDPERRLKLAEQGYERAADLTWDTSEANLVSAYERLLA
ncbi:MAG: glycosyltransferase family 4 protein [Mycobacteriales bacterium]